MLNVPSKAFLEFYTGAAVTFAVLVSLTAFNAVAGGAAWIVAGLLLAWLEFDTGKR